MDSLVQNFPDEAAKAMGDYPDRLLVAQTRHIAAIENLKDASFVFNRGVGSLIEDAPHMTIALRGAVTVADARALVVTGGQAPPKHGRSCLGSGGAGCENSSERKRPQNDQPGEIVPISYLQLDISVVS